MEQIQKRLRRAMQQLRSEMAAAGEVMPDCEVVVRLADGEITVEPTPEYIPTPSPSPLHGEGNKEGQKADRELLRSEGDDASISPEWEAGLTAPRKDKTGRKKKA